MRSSQIFPHRHPTEIRKELLEPGFGPAQVDVLPETGAAIGLGNPGALGVQFPGMEINHGGVAFLIDPANPPRGYPVGIEAKIAATPQGNVSPQEFYGGRRDFNQAVLQGEGEAGATPQAIDVMMADGKDTGVINKPRLLNQIQGPQSFFHDGKAGGPITLNRFAHDIFQNLFGAPHKILKLPWS